MSSHARAVASFPSARIPSRSGGSPIEVALIAQLGHGSGDQLVASAGARQRAHEQFIDALDESSAKLAGTDVARGDLTALYSFAVGATGHPFHRHAGHRVFTAISGSGGVQLRFSDATSAQLADDPASFLRALHYIDIPPDCLFSVRFGGDTWHQFSPPHPRSGHPALFALSCHTNELGGDLSADLQRQVCNNEGTIQSLTEILPPAVQRLLDDQPVEGLDVPTIALSLDAPAGSLHSAMCRVVRGCAGKFRSAWIRLRQAGGFTLERGAMHVVAKVTEPASDSLLREHLGVHHHQDMFALVLEDALIDGLSATELLGALLDSFISHPPVGVSYLMALRNLLVKPFGLRTSPLGCPVSSLLDAPHSQQFLGRYPVRDQRVTRDNTVAQVILGADDRHLRFRSCVAARVLGPARVELTLGTRVQCTNLFGRLYMALIDHVHRRYISPAMLRMAAEQVLAQKRNGIPMG